MVGICSLVTKAGKVTVRREEIVFVLWGTEKDNCEGCSLAIIRFYKSKL